MIYIGNGRYLRFNKLTLKEEELTQDEIFEYERTKYQRDRKVEYDKLNQDELRYNDLVNGTNIWIEAIQNIKAKFPKPE